MKVPTVFWWYSYSLSIVVDTWKVLEHKQIVMTYTNELNVCFVSTILPPILPEFLKTLCTWSKFIQMRNILLLIPIIVDVNYEVHLPQRSSFNTKIYKDNRPTFHYTRKLWYCKYYMDNWFTSHKNTKKYKSLELTKLMMGIFLYSVLPGRKAKSQWPSLHFSF